MSLWRDIDARGLECLDERVPGWLVVLERWLPSSSAAVLECLERYVHDRQSLPEPVGGRSQVPLVGLEPLGTESHNGGRRPMLLRFADGTLLVYKPRSAAAERMVADVLARLHGERGQLPGLRVPDVLDRGTHCWSAHVPHLASDDPTLHLGHFRRLGGWLAVAHGLRISDLHHENIIAHGIDPVPVDLEVMLQPRLPWSTPRVDARDQSILATGLMPSRAPGTGGEDLNRSGIPTGTVVRQAVQELGIDPRGSLWLRSRRRALPARNAPFRNAPDPGSWDALTEAVLEGFSLFHKALSGLARDRDFRQWIRERTCGFEARVLLRETAQYAQLHEALHHPKVLAGELAAEVVLDKLGLAARRAPGLQGALGAERASLLQGDVPAFHARTDCTGLFWQGERIARDFFPESGSSVLERSLDRLGRSDRRRQRPLIAEGMGRYLSPRPFPPLAESASRLERVAHLGREPCSHRQSADGIAPPRAAVVLAGSIASWLLEREVCDHWFSSQFSPERGTVTPVAVGDRLGDGRLGIALFLAAVSVHDRPDLDEIARRVFRSIAGNAAQGRVPDAAGAHDGIGGLVWGLCAGAGILRDDALLRSAEDLMPAVLEQVAVDRRFDLYAGSAGALLACCELARIHGSERALEVARTCRERLLSAAVEVGSGAAWPNPVAPEGAHLLGMAHGTHGIAMALARLQSIDPDPAAADLLESVRAYEDERFDARTGRWPDLRKPPGLDLDPEREESWCSGSAGIGLAWLDRTSVDATAAPAGPVALALEATSRKLESRSACLCHGTLGNAWHLHRHDQVHGLQERRALVARALANVLAEVRERGVICGVEPNRPMPGLMSGMAGVGYGLLMLCGREPLPDPLSLRLCEW